MLPGYTAAGPQVILHPGKTYNLGSKLADELVKNGYAREGGGRPERIPAQPDVGDKPDAGEDEPEDD
jgi:hypothetical protein